MNKKGKKNSRRGDERRRWRWRRKRKRRRIIEGRKRVRVVDVNRTRHRGIGRRYGSGGGRVAGGEGGGGGGMSAGTGGRDDEEEEKKTAGNRDGRSWYRGWRWRWQSQCPSTRTGSRRVAANDPKQFFTLHRASKRAKRVGGRRGER